LLTAAIVVVILMTPALMQRLFALPVATTLSANSVATFALACGCLAFGWAADRYGAARILGIGSALLLCAVYALYFGVAHDGGLLRPLYGIAGFCVGVVGVVPTIMVRAFEPAVRFSGLSFSYNLAYALFGGLTPLMVVLLMRLSPMAPAHYVAALCLAGVLVAIWLHRGRTDSLNRSV
jgi:MFS family permease